MKNNRACYGSGRACTKKCPGCAGPMYRTSATCHKCRSLDKDEAASRRAAELKAERDREGEIAAAAYDHLEWRSLPWLHGYEVSESGLVRATVDHWTSPKRGDLVTGSTSQGYLRYKLGQRAYLAHRLVCEAWHGPAPRAGMHVAHGDGSRDNNHYSNLRWATPKENCADRNLHGTAPTGERNPKSKLTWEAVRSIRASLSGEPGEVSRLARQYGLSYPAMAAVCEGRNWREPAQA